MGQLVIIIDSLYIDISTIGLIIYWIWKPKHSVFMFGLFFFYIIRSFTIKIGQWPTIDFMIFKNIPFPSIMISYEETNDFYFSGHTGLCFVLFLEHYHRKNLAIWVVSLFFFFYTVFMLIYTGAHYTNDVIIGFICSISFYFIAKKF